MIFEKLSPNSDDLLREIHSTIFEIKGFRSLQNFSIKLSPGLNVLLGPNGSGKTNFIDFQDFLTNVVNRNISSAVSAAGGISRVFSQESLKRKIPRIIARVSGVADMTPHYAGNVNKPFFHFEYEIDIRYSKLHTAVYIANERIKFKSLFSNIFEDDRNSTVGSIDLHRFSPVEDEVPRWKVGSYLLTGSTRNPLRPMHLHRIATKKFSGETRMNARAQLLSHAPLTSPDESILSTRSAFPALDAVKSALARGQSFNLNPQRARQPDDISTPPSIGPDGAGLSATIYQMQQLERSDSRPTIVRRRMPKTALKTIISWSKLIMPDLTGISATADPHTGKYIAFLHVGDEDRLLKIPLQSTSDGTLRWLAFTSLIVGGYSGYTFEEPENYLHPKMQQFLIDLLRESIDDTGNGERFIVSTHSETLINQCNPDEIILFSFEDGETKCARLSNSDSLVERVNKTGFGLGHYYALNTLR